MRLCVIVILIIILILLLTRKEDGFSEGIPRIIHQTAPADKEKWHPVWEHCQKSWKEKFPNWEYKFWSDEDLDEFMKTKFQWFYKTWKDYPKNIQRIDSARYFILYEYGGIYADMDFECITNFEHELPLDKVSIAESPVKSKWWLYFGNTETHQNALMVSPAQHPFWLFVFNVLVDNKEKENVLYSTGPQVIIHAINKVPEMVYSLPSEKFAPAYDDDFKTLHETGMTTIKEFKNTDVYSRHHGSSMWIKN